MINNYINLYPLSKTLRFELRPIGESVNYLEDFKSQHLKDVVAEDKIRAERYQLIKVLIDEYHQNYIQERLSYPANKKTGELYITPEDFEEAYSYYQNLKFDPRDKKARKNWETTQASLRKKLVKSFDRNSELFQKELITRNLPEWLKSINRWEENQEVVESFNKFTTYFTGFHENRRNMYSAEEKSTAISFRLMNENLPRFFDNCSNYKEIKAKHAKLKFSAPKGLLKSMGVKSIDEIFQPRYFINLYAQTSIDNFQELIGGKTLEDGKKIKGLNEEINLHRQKNHLKSRELSGFTPLYKQILSDRESRSFVLEAFENDKELLEAIKTYIDTVNSNDGLIDQLKKSVATLEDANLEKVYIRGNALTTISQAIFGNFGVISAALWYQAETVEFPTPKNGKVNAALQKKREGYTKQEAFSLAELDSMLTVYLNTLESDDPLREKIQNSQGQPILYHLQHAIEETINDSELSRATDNVKKLFKLDTLSKKRNPPKGEKDKGSEGFQQVQTIQNVLDAFMQISQSVKPLHLVKGRKPIVMPDMDTAFYTEFVTIYEEYSELTINLYNKVRNYLTKKPYTKEKFKINFNSPTLLNGWDVNKETDNSAVLFERDGLYYLGIMHHKHKNLFDYTKNIDDLADKKKISVKDERYNNITDNKHAGYQKIVYKQLPNINQMLPKVFFSDLRIEYFAPSKDILRIRNTASSTKNGKPQTGHKKKAFSLTDCHKMIDFYKASIKKHPEWREFGFKFSPTKTYEDLSGFYREVERQAYSIQFHPIKDSYINDCVKNGKLFLFQIYNKDFSTFSKGNPNLHTLFWRGLFEPDNLKDVVLKLNGQAEIFYRPHSINKNDITVHTAGKELKNKNINNPEATSVFNYDIVKDRRYTQDKFYFHVPITLNFKSEGITNFNDKVNNDLKKQKHHCVIGIDRGERHLLYYSVINASGKIIEQGSLNEITTDQGYNVDYHQKLDEKEKERDKARKSWSSIENIKELKQGYLSHVIHKLARLIIRHNAIVCLEDLNFGFKRGRFKIEKQVYQKFEKVLINKLNYLVLKDAKPGAPGHYLNAYQLTAPFVSFEKLFKQSGILFYVAAAYTSKIDPKTGFMNFLKTRYESLAKSKLFFEQLDSIRFNSKKDYFQFEFDYQKMRPDFNLGNYQKKWQACTHGEIRYQNQRDKNGIWKTEAVNVTESLEQLFNDAGIQYQKEDELKNAIAEKKDTKFYKKLFRLLGLTLTLRHSMTGTDEDFILSPIAGKDGVFFDSRRAKKNEPKDADANGAYHIALKGLWNLEQIRKWDGKAQIKLAMKNVEWFDFIQSRL